MRRLIKNNSESWSDINVKRLTRVRPCCSNENIAAVRDNVAETPTTSIRHLAQEKDLTHFHCVAEIKLS